MVGILPPEKGDIKTPIGAPTTSTSSSTRTIVIGVIVILALIALGYVLTRG
jgi:hypothetical protein